MCSSTWQTKLTLDSGSKGESGETRLGSEFGSYSKCKEKPLPDPKRLRNLVRACSHGALPTLSCSECFSCIHSLDADSSPPRDESCCK